MSKSAVILTVIFIGQMAVVHTVSLGERVLPVPGLRMLPAQIGGWSLSEEQQLEPDVAAYLKPDDYILRGYANEETANSVNLFIAYFQSLQNSYGPHSPRVCLPGAGWMTRTSKIIPLQVRGRPEGIRVNQYILEKGNQQIVVLYWYQNDRRVWAEELQAKLYLLPDLLRYRRSDVSLVRIITAVGRDGSIEAPLKKAVEFGRELFPQLQERLTPIG